MRHDLEEQCKMLKDCFKAKVSERTEILLFTREISALMLNRYLWLSDFDEFYISPLDAVKLVVSQPCLRL